MTSTFGSILVTTIYKYCLVYCRVMWSDISFPIVPMIRYLCHFKKSGQIDVYFFLFQFPIWGSEVSLKYLYIPHLCGEGGEEQRHRVAMTIWLSGNRILYQILI